MELLTLNKKFTGAGAYNPKLKEREGIKYEE